MKGSMMKRSKALMRESRIFRSPLNIMKRSMPSICKLKKMSRLCGLVLFALVSCDKEKKNLSEQQDNETNVRVEIIESKDTQAEYDLIGSTENMDSSDFGKLKYHNSDWLQYEENGDPDTALVMFAYRLIKTGERPYYNYDAFINLHKDSTVVMQVLINEFGRKENKMHYDSAYRHLLSGFAKYSDSVVNYEIDKYGISDGPYMHFLNLVRN
ncbi:MAG: hypothetical protein KDC92_03205 [Bacteroidetes bacterium]|nr:hypothetical protein [Bacteroidota bacterium]